MLRGFSSTGLFCQPCEGLFDAYSEDALHQLFVAHVPVKEIRMVLDKFTSAPRGFAFVHFHTVADASRMLNTFQVMFVN